MPLTRAQRLRKRQLELSKPEAPADGMFLFDQISGQGEVFMSFEELAQTTREIMAAPDYVVEQELGKMHYKSDPTYNMRRRK